MIAARTLARVWGCRVLGHALLVTLIMLWACPAGAANPRLRVVFTEWLPYTFQENGRAAGFEIDILQAVLKDMGLEAEFTSYPWKRCLAALRHGQADALVSLLKTPERQEYALYPQEHISLSKTTFFTAVDKQIAFDGSYGQLRGYTIGVIAGFSYGEAFDKAGYLRKEEVRDAEMLIRKVLSGRNDLAAENQAVVSGVALRMGVRDELRFLEPPIHTRKLYVGFAKAKRLQGLCREFSQALSQFKKTDAYQAILVKYGVNFPGMAD
ncbi:MAG: transporter substrate-binding domain-containing protein [Pseudomonadota bacterium]